MTNPIQQYFARAFVLKKYEMQLCEERLEKNRQQFEKDRQALIEALKQKSDSLGEQFSEAYDGRMANAVEDSAQVMETAKLKSLEEEYIRLNREAKGVEKRRNEMRDARRSIGDHVVENFSSIRKESIFSALKKIGADFSGDLKEWFDNAAEWNETRREADRASSEELLRSVKDLYTDTVTRVQARIEEQSKAYWEESPVFSRRNC